MFLVETADRFSHYTYGSLTKKEGALLGSNRDSESMIAESTTEFSISPKILREVRYCSPGLWGAFPVLYPQTPKGYINNVQMEQLNSANRMRYKQKSPGLETTKIS